MKNKTLITGNGYYCSPNMVQFCEHMVAKEMLQARIDHEVRMGLRPAPSNFGTWNVSDRH